MRILLFLIALVVDLPLLAVKLPWLNLVTNGIQQKLSCREAFGEDIRFKSA